MKKIARSQFIFPLLAGAASVLLTAGLISAIRTKGLPSAEAAGWMQAIGSIIAIGAAIYIMNRQHENQRTHAEQAENTERANLMLAALMVGNEALNVAETFSTGASGNYCLPAVATFPLDQMNHVVRHADQIPMWKMNAGCARSFYRISNGTHQIAAMLRLAIEENTDVDSKKGLPANVYIGGVKHAIAQNARNISVAVKDLEEQYEDLTGIPAPLQDPSGK